MMRSVQLLSGDKYVNPFSYEHRAAHLCVRMTLIPTISFAEAVIKNVTINASDIRTD